MRIGDQTLTSRQVALGVSAAAAALVLAIGLFSRKTRLDGSASGAEEELEKLDQILAELSRKVFNFCMNLAGIAKKVRVQMKASNVQSTEERLRAQLTLQCKVRETIEQIESEVAAEFGFSTAGLQELQQRHLEAGTPSMVSFAEGFKTMLDDALGGAMPIMPHARLPEELTPEHVLKLLVDAQALTLVNAKAEVAETLMPRKELTECVSKVQAAAWDLTLDAEPCLQGERHKTEVYYSALATHLRKEDFAKKRNKQEQAHQGRMAKFLKSKCSDL